MMKRTAVVLMVALLALTVGCGSDEEKKARFFDKGSTLFEKGDYVKARLEFKNALQIDPKFARAYLMLGKVEMKEKQFKQAFGFFSKATEIDPDLLEAQVELARIFIAARAEDRAWEKVDLVLAKDPQNDGARLAQAALLIKSEQADKAETILDDLYKNGATSPELYLMLASIYNQRDDATGIAAMLSEGIQKNPDATNLKLVLANFYMQTEKPADAEKILKDLVDDQPETGAHRLALADFYWKTNQPDRADAVLRDLSALETPDRETNTITAVQFYINQNALAGGEALLLKGIEADPQSFKLREALADLYLLKKDPQAAIATLEKNLTLSSDPADPGILSSKSRLARIFLILRDNDRAEALADAVLKENARSVDGNLVKGQLQLATGRGADAVTTLRTVVAEAPENVNGHLMLAQAHLLNEETPLAIDALNQGIRQNPSAKALRRALARVYMVDKQFDNAEKTLVKMTEIDPDDIRAIGDLGDFKLSRQQYDDAVRQYEKMIATAPKAPGGYLKLARLHELRQAPAASLDVLQRGYDANPEALPLLAGLVRGYLLENNIADARTLCETRIAADPDNAFLYNLLAQVHLTAKEPDAAEKALKAAITRRPDWSVPHDNLARLYLSQGKTDAAIDNLTANIAQNPHNTAAYMTLALLYDRKGDVANAKSVYEKALAANPRQWAAANNLAFLLAEYPDSADDLDRAMELAQKAERIKPEEPTVLDTVGWIYHKKGNRSEAQRVFEKALEINPEIAVVNYHMARVLVDSDRITEARAYLAKALADGTDYPEKELARSLFEEIRTRTE